MRIIVFIIGIFLMAGCQSGNKNQDKSEEKPVQIVSIEETLNIGGMHCDMCVASIEKGVSSVEGVEFVNVSLDDSTAVVRFDEAQTSLAEIKQAVEKRGYTVKEGVVKP